MSEAKQYTIKISSGSDVVGQEFYFMTPSVFDDAGTRVFENKQQLEKTLMQFMVGATQAGVDLVLKHVEQRGSSIFYAKLTEQSAKHFGWNF